MLKKGVMSRSHFPEQKNQDLKPGLPSTYPCISLRVVARIISQ